MWITTTIDGYRLRGNLRALPFGYCSHGPLFAYFSTPYNSTNNTTFHHHSFSSPLTSHSSVQCFGLCTSQTSATPTSLNDYVGGYLLPNSSALRSRSAASIHVSDSFDTIHLHHVEVSDHYSAPTVGYSTKPRYLGASKYAKYACSCSERRQIHLS